MVGVIYVRFAGYAQCWTDVMKMDGLLILFCSLLAASCGSTKAIPLRPGGPGDDLQLAAASWQDRFGGSDSAVGLRFELHSTSDHVLEGCALLLDNRYRASLADLEVYRGFFAGNDPRARSDLRPGESARFEFHHDNNNRLILRRRDGDTAPPDYIPTRITVSCDGWERSWERDR